MPNSAQTRRDPQQGKNGFSNHKGFTLIELMIAIAVLAIVTSLALPSYRMIIEKRQVTSGAEQFRAFMSSAQFESVRRNQPVAVNFEWNSGNWCLGMRTHEELASVTCDCTITQLANASACVMDGELRVINSDNLNYPDVLQSASSLGGADDNLIYDPVRGLIVGNETASMQFLSDDSSYALNVVVAPTGQMNICSNDSASAHTVPGYESC